METGIKFEMTLAAYTAIIAENAKLKSLLNYCEFILEKAAGYQIRRSEIEKLNANECECAIKLSDDYLIQMYSFDSSIQILMDKVPCFSVPQIRNAMAKSIRKELHIRLEALKMFDKFIGNTENAG